MISIISSITGRHSPRAFSDKAVSTEETEALFEAARWAPSAFNHQPWRFVVADKNKNINLYDKIFASLEDFNRKWAITAPILVAVIAYSKGPKGNTNKYAWYDTGQAVSNLCSQATSMGIFAHQMGGFDPSIISKNLNLSDDFEPVTVIAIGYKGDIKKLPEKIQELEIKKIRERKALGEFVYYKEF